MARILAIDYGTKRCGIAATDSLQLIASPLQAVKTSELLQFLQTYIGKEQVEAIVIGKPLQNNGQPSIIEPQIQKFIKELMPKLNHIQLVRYDERYTSSLAIDALISSGTTRKQRQNKSLIDVTSATIILQSFLQEKEILKQRQSS
ncbi:MAG: Holliday junction resolvase RuvX [Bacteroidetes bacterium]|nr:Holliday junction resolvase RuvX [Bacteroidota bacterium]